MTTSHLPSRLPARTALLLCASLSILATPAWAEAAKPAATAETAAPQVVKTDAFSHGPQLGNVTASSIRIWARTRQPGEFRVLYSTNPDLSGGVYSGPVRTSWESDPTGWIELKGLKPNTKYYYALVIGDKVADTRIDGQANSFLTLPDSSAFVDPVLNPKGLFNFAFEMGTGNNQVAGAAIPPTFDTMRKNLKDRIHFQIQNGDWIYEVGRDVTESDWAKTNGVTRQPRITRLAKGIAGVCENYKRYLDNPALANFYREIPQFVTADDHEILNDVTGSGQPGLRFDARGAPWQAKLQEDGLDATVERAVFRDPALAAWRHYVGWANPDSTRTQPALFGEAKTVAGSSILTDPSADFSKLDLSRTSNLHVLWGYGNTGVYRIKRVVGRNQIEVEPSFTTTEQARYSISTNFYSKFTVGNTDVFLLDTRTNRTLHDKANPADPKTTMLGAAQKEWLFNELGNSKADFVFITSTVNLAVPHDNGARYGQGTGGPGKDDGWTAHLHERAELLKVAESLGKPVFFLTGDLHKSFVARIAPGVYDIATGPHTSSNHRLGDAGGSPPSGWYKSGDRLVNILWSSTQYRNDSGSDGGRPKDKGWPIYTVVRVNNAYNVPDKDGKDRWIAHPEPQVVFEFRDGHTGELSFAHSVSTSDAKPAPQPVSLDRVRELGGIAPPASR